MKRQAPSGPGGLERRRGRRISVPRRASGVSVVGAELLALSRYGMMIESPLPLELETVLKLRLIVEGEKTDVEARVAACTLGRRADKQRFAVGLEFTQIGPRTQALLAEALAASGGSLPPAQG